MAAQLDTILKKLDALKSEYRANVIQTVQAIMAEHDIQPDELSIRKKAPTKKAAPKAASKPTKKAPAKKAAAPTKKAAKKRRKLNLVPKYQDPETGATWTGHARPPAWIANAPDREVFRIPDAA